MNATEKTPFERLIVSLQRLIRLRELRAQDVHIQKEIKLANKVWSAAARSPDALELPWPVELVPVAEELGFLAAEAAPANLLLIAGHGPGPSALSTEDAGARVQREAGYEPTDYAGLFSGMGPFVVSPVPRTFSLREGAEVTDAGKLRVRSGRLCTFDPLDSTYLDRTVQRLDRDVPTGEHPVHIAHWGRNIAAALVTFDRGSVRSWVPARFDADSNPMPRPPVLPMAAVRFSVALCDERALEEMLATVRVARTREDVNCERALLTLEPLGPDEPLPPPVMRGVPAVIEQLRDDLGKYAVAIQQGILGAKVDWPVPANWGLNDAGAVTALALDFGAVRIAQPDRVTELSLSDLRANPRGMLVDGYRVRLEDGPTLVVEAEGGTDLDDVQWLSVESLLSFEKAAGERWTRSTKVHADREKQLTRFSPPPGSFTKAGLVFSSVSRSGVLLERRSLATRLWDPTAATPPAISAWDLGGRLGGLLKAWCKSGDTQRIENALARVPSAHPRSWPTSERVPAHPLTSDDAARLGWEPTLSAPKGIRFDMAGRSVALFRAADSGQWQIRLSGQPLTTVFCGKEGHTTNAASYNTAALPRVVEGFSIAGDDILGIRELEVGRGLEGYEARALWGGRIKADFAVAIYEYHHLRLVVPEDFSKVVVTYSVSTDTSS